ncbi:50S ribosomal protein L5 [Candidatus Dependentiae bacterium]|nr:50S ribosomal protein L5 [Candidatus Dependentiae bacterium]
MSSRLETLYKETLRPALQKELGVKNVMQIPRLSKVVINMGVKDAVGDSKVLNAIRDIISDIAGQSAVRTKARNSIAGFKLREGAPIGVMVTLRKQRMYDFLDKLINVALPGVRDFQGVTTKFDGNGNYNLGMQDWFVFPEVDYDSIDKSRGLNISVHTTAKDDNSAYALLKSFNMPFRK